MHTHSVRSIVLIKTERKPTDTIIERRLLAPTLHTISEAATLIAHTHRTLSCSNVKSRAIHCSINANIKFATGITRYRQSESDASSLTEIVFTKDQFCRPNRRSNRHPNMRHVVKEVLNNLRHAFVVVQPTFLRQINSLRAKKEDATPG